MATLAFAKKPNASDTCLVVWQTGETVTHREFDGEGIHEHL